MVLNYLNTEIMINLPASKHKLSNIIPQVSDDNN